MPVVCHPQMFFLCIYKCFVLVISVVIDNKLYLFHWQLYVAYNW